MKKYIPNVKYLENTNRYLRKISSTEQIAKLMDMGCVHMDNPRQNPINGINASLFLE
jgi:hypothetical protein